MEKTRTLYRLRKFKNSIMVNGLALLFGITLFSTISVFENSIYSFMKEKATGALTVEYQNNINSAIGTCTKAYEMLEKSSLYSIVFALEGFLMIVILIRLSKKTSKFSIMAPLVLGFGAVLISVFYLIIGFLLPNGGQLAQLQNDYVYLRIAGVILILLSNIAFLYQVFTQVVLENIED